MSVHNFQVIAGNRFHSEIRCQMGPDVSRIIGEFRTDLGSDKAYFARIIPWLVALQSLVGPVSHPQYLRRKPNVQGHLITSTLAAVSGNVSQSFRWVSEV